MKRPVITWLETDLALRAVAILAVTWNHANPLARGALGGGMTFLFMLSGYNFARFAILNSNIGRLRRALVMFALRVFVPSMALVMFFSLLLHDFFWQEFLFISNWWTIERVSIFPTWYPQVLLQILVGLYAAFSVPAIGGSLLRRPLVWSMVLFVVAVLVRLLGPMFWDTSHLRHNLPHLYLWNFVLGWVVFFLMVDRSGSKMRWVAAAGCLVLGAFVGWGYERLDFWWLIVAGLILITVSRLPIPTVIARAVMIVGQATFAIFLLHRFFFFVFVHLFPRLQGEVVIQWAFGVVSSVLVWVLLVALQRAHVKLALPRLNVRVYRRSP